jgi:hypothetical protein
VIVCALLIKAVTDVVLIYTAGAEAIGVAMAPR